MDLHSTLNNVSFNSFFYRMKSVFYNLPEDFREKLNLYNFWRQRFKIVLGKNATGVITLFRFSTTTSRLWLCTTVAPVGAEMSASRAVFWLFEVEMVKPSYWRWVQKRFSPHLFCCWSFWQVVSDFCKVVVSPRRYKDEIGRHFSCFFDSWWWGFQNSDDIVAKWTNYVLAFQHWAIERLQETIHFH